MGLSWQDSVCRLLVFFNSLLVVPRFKLVEYDKFAVSPPKEGCPDYVSERTIWAGALWLAWIVWNCIIQCNTELQRE